MAFIFPILDLIDFLHALTDPSALDLRDSVPPKVPSRLPLADQLMNDTNQPAALVCEILPTTQQEEKEVLWQHLSSECIAYAELEKGYQLLFPLSDENVSKLTQVIELERACCKFLTINLEIPSQDNLAAAKNDIKLSMTGASADVKPTLKKIMEGIGFQFNETKNTVPSPSFDAVGKKFVLLGSSGIFVGILCCILPFLAIPFGLTGLSYWLGVVESNMLLLAVFSFSLIGVGLYLNKKRKARINDCEC